jgi:outer membrane receptor protein involved in Fe transport
MLPMLVLAQEVQIIVPLKKDEEEKPPEITVRSKPPPRGASDWQIDKDTLSSVPHETGADVLGTLPGVFVSNRGLLGQAPHLSLRGFEGTSGQDMEIVLGNIPLNQVSNIRAPGYADMRLVVPEVVRDVRVSHGAFDPRQGDFALAGSAHMDLGMQDPGFLAKGTLGSFGTRRALLAFAPDHEQWRDSFAAVEAYATDGPGSGRGGERSSFTGQLAFNENRFRWRGLVAVGSARFDFPALLAQSALDSGAYPYGALSPLGRDLTSQAHIGNELVWDMADGPFTLGIYVSKTRMQMHENLTGYVRDVLAGMAPTNSDDAEQVNDAMTYGLTASYQHVIKLISERDSVEFGASARIDQINQTDTRLNPDGTIDQRLVDAAIDATGVAAYADASIYPIKRIVVRGGARLDSLSYSVNDRLGASGLERTSQGMHFGPKATVDYAAGSGVHLLASYGEGFRSPQARLLSEGERVPFATIQSVEAGARWKDRHVAQASIVGFASWLDQDLVFDALQRANIAAPSSSRSGVAAAFEARLGVFGTTASATYTHAVFTGSDQTFHAGDAVPYAPALVVRDDAFIITPMGKLSNSPIKGRFGVGLQGAFGAMLPGGDSAKPAAYVDALASVAWRAFEVSLNGMNLLDRRYDDLQYVYVSNFGKGSTLQPASSHVLVAPPAAVFVTLQVLLQTQPRAESD